MYIRQLLCIFPCLGGIFALPSPEASDQATYQGIGSSFGVAGVDASFDYVVVGGGTAGLVMAARLAEDSSVSVAVIEAGGFYEVDNGNISVIPAEAATFAGTDPSDTNPLVDWGFITEPQKVCHSLIKVFGVLTETDSFWREQIIDECTMREARL